MAPRPVVSKNMKVSPTIRWETEHTRFFPPYGGFLYILVGPTLRWAANIKVNPPYGGFLNIKVILPYGGLRT